MSAASSEAQAGAAWRRRPSVGRGAPPRGFGSGLAHCLHHGIVRADAVGWNHRAETLTTSEQLEVAMADRIGARRRRKVSAPVNTAEVDWHAQATLERQHRDQQHKQSRIETKAQAKRQQAATSPGADLRAASAPGPEAAAGIGEWGRGPE